MATLCVAVTLMSGCGLTSDAGAVEWQAIEVDAAGPHDPWGKAVGDINGDGRPDMVVGGHGPERPDLWRRLLDRLGLIDYEWPDKGLLVWYESPNWTRHVVSTGYQFRTDLEVADINGDGRNDIVATTDAGVVWFSNPDWMPHLVGDVLMHDVEVADLDGDGKLDIVTRDQQLFGHDSGDRIHFFRQEASNRWTRTAMKVPQGEGLRLADLDGDGRQDVVVNQVWYRNPGSVDAPERWQAMAYCASWNWPHAYIDVADMNGDGQPDVVLAPAEPAGSYHRLSWCEAPAKGEGQWQWQEHVVDARVESVMHSVVAGDFDLDGRTDIAAATMQQGVGPEDVAVYLQREAGQPWSRSVIGTRGSHAMKAFDFDQDGDLDLMGAHWNGDHQPVMLWVNTHAGRTAADWRRHVIDDGKPWRSLFVRSADLDGDGLLDIVTGGWWYRNPGRADGHWARQTIGAPANNMLLLRDFDGDGHVDVFSSTWNTPRQWTLYERFLRKAGLRAWPDRGGVAWARNDGSGRFEVMSRLEPGKGDYPQGAAAITDPQGSRVVLSWHATGLGLQQWHVPAREPERAVWRVSELSAISQDEALSVADLDSDGRDDLVLGTRWLHREAADAWTAHTLHDTRELPDRHRVADIDGDGRLDVVVGYEAVSIMGKLAWYSPRDRADATWTEHVIARIVGPMSLDLADMDGDGDLDVVVGEHNLRHPRAARLLWFENRLGDARPWAQHLIYTGDEHHDGAHVVDIDGDGDLDVVSIGWGHDSLVIYENLSISTS